MSAVGRDSKMQDEIEDIQFLFWNTSLSPPKTQSRANQEHWEFVASQLELAQKEFGWDVLGLCEVNDRDVKEILAALKTPHLSSVDIGKRNTAAINDIAIVYDRRKLSFVDAKRLLDKHGGQSLKAGHRATFLHLASQQVLHVVVSHWPGRLYFDEPAPKRAQLGMSLHRSLKKLRMQQPSHIVLMGDYNDDPSSPSLANHLLATRDRAMAKAVPHMLYNPFWRRMGESHDPHESEPGVCGTHYYSGGTSSRWFTFDQIMFSSTILSSPDFDVDESLTQIVRLPMIAERITRDDSIYDHYPVSGRLLVRAAP